MLSILFQKRILASLLAFVAVSCSPQSSTPPAPDDTSTTSPNRSGNPIVVADVSDEPAKKIERFQPFADYLATQLDDVGISVGEVEIAPDMSTMAEWLASGKVDVYFDSPYPAMIVSDLSGAQPILRRWKDGVEAYHTVIFARKASGIDTIEELEGQAVAFEEPFSTSGYMLPLSSLIEAGFQPVEKQSANASVAANEVGYVFSGDDENSIQWVLTGRVAAAAVGEPDFLEIPENIRQELVILAETDSLPRHLVVVSPTLSPEEVTAIEAALLAMDDTAEGRAVLSAWEDTSQFDEFPEGADQALSRMRELYELTQDQ